MTSSAVGELVQRLPPTASSAGAARLLVTEALSTWGHDEHTETARLLVSELVTNAVLHSGTEIELRATADGSRVRIEVHDGSTSAPGLRHYDQEAATGRGLGMVETLSSAWGVEPGAAGKVVWFELGDLGHRLDPALEVASAGTSVHGALTRVELIGLPAALVHATVQYGDAVLRELALLSMAGELGEDVAPLYRTPEVDLSQILGGVEAALAEGRPVIDLEVRLPLTEAEKALGRLALVDEADRLAREGRLLSVPAVPEIGSCRHWLMTEIAVQLRGEPPSRWQLPPMADPATEWHPLDAAEEGVLAPPGTVVVISDEANRILFVSGAAAALLGWEPDALTGQRLTTIIPPALREAHLAGFTRFQVTGEERLLGRSVRVPALRKDGSEVEVELTIDSLRRSGGRQIFRAMIVMQGG